MPEVLWKHPTNQKTVDAIDHEINGLDSDWFRKQKTFTIRPTNSENYEKKKEDLTLNELRKVLQEARKPPIFIKKPLFDVCTKLFPDFVERAKQSGIDFSYFMEEYNEELKYSHRNKRRKWLRQLKVAAGALPAALLVLGQVSWIVSASSAVSSGIAIVTCLPALFVFSLLSIIPGLIYEHSGALADEVAFCRKESLRSKNLERLAEFVKAKTGAGAIKMSDFHNLKEYLQGEINIDEVRLAAGVTGWSIPQVETSADTTTLDRDIATKKREYDALITEIETAKKLLANAESDRQVEEVEIIMQAHSGKKTR